MKKIDKLIFQTFLGPFLITVVVVDFIFLTHYLLRYIDELVGKGLPFAVYAELIFYFSLNMVPNALPLSVLLASLMTYGNLGEHKELTAIKASGISLLRTLRPLFFFALLLTGVLFVFHDRIVPRANLKAYSLLYDIREKKPALNIKEGSFYNGLDGYSIKVREKDDDGEGLNDVIIYDHSERKGNLRVTIAEAGRMYTFNNEQYLKLELYNGHSYREHTEKNDYIRPEQFVRTQFDTSEVVISLASFGLDRTPEQLFESNRLMKNIGELQHEMDSLTSETRQMAEHIYENAEPFYNFPVAREDSVVNDDTAVSVSATIGNMSSSQKKMMYSRAANHARSVTSYVKSRHERIDRMTKLVHSHHVELLKKFTQSMAVIIMFLIGAPLGAIIKKGGFGVPVLISILFFIFYYIASMLGEKYSKEGVVDPVLGMWAANLILFPLGLFFLKQARSDSRILDTDFYAVAFEKIKRLFRKKRISS